MMIFGCVPPLPAAPKLRFEAPGATGFLSEETVLPVEVLLAFMIWPPRCGFRLRPPGMVSARKR